MIRPDIEKTFTVIDPKGSSIELGQKVTIKLTKDSGFPGVTLSFNKVSLSDKTNKDKIILDVEYEVIKVPKKFNKLSEELKEKFETLLDEIFVSLMRTTSTFKCDKSCEDCDTCKN